MTSPTPLQRYIFRIAFALVGIGATVIASTLEPLTTYFGIALENGGLFTGAFFIGGTLGIFIGGNLLDRTMSRRVSVSGAGIFGIFLFLMILIPAHLAIIGFICVVCIGFGYGFLVISGNGLAPRYNPQNPARELSAINFFFGLGAIIGPQIANIAFTMGDFRLMYLIVGTLAIVSAATFMYMPSIAPVQKSETAVKVVWVSLIPFGVMFFMYVGVEMGFSAWISPQLTLAALADASTGAVGISLFWTGMTLGRLLTSVIAGKIASETVLLGGMGLVGVGVLGVLIFPTTVGMLLVFSFIVGFGCAPIFPLGMAILNSRYTQGFGAISGAIIAVGNSGAVVLPALQGWAGRGLDGGMIVSLMAIIIALACALVAMRKPQAQVTS